MAGVDRDTAGAGLDTVGVDRDMVGAARRAGELPDLCGEGSHQSAAGGVGCDEVAAATARRVKPSPDYDAGGGDAPCFGCTALHVSQLG